MNRVSYPFIQGWPRMLNLHNFYRCYFGYIKQCTPARQLVGEDEACARARVRWTCRSYRSNGDSENGEASSYRSRNGISSPEKYSYLYLLEWPEPNIKSMVDEIPRAPVHEKHSLPLGFIAWWWVFLLLGMELWGGICRPPAARFRPGRIIIPASFMMGRNLGIGIIICLQVHVLLIAWIARECWELSSWKKSGNKRWRKEETKKYNIVGRKTAKYKMFEGSRESF